jgi:hypothetical protein
VEFGVPGWSPCHAFEQLWALYNGRRESHTFVKGENGVDLKMGCCKYFVNCSAELSRIATVDVHKPSLSG